jgi:hypothetical protein
LIFAAETRKLNLSAGDEKTMITRIRAFFAADLFLALYALDISCLVRLSLDLHSAIY